MLHQIGLFGHMVAILLVGGGSIGAIMAETQLWKRVQAHSPEARLFIPIVKGAPVFIFAGIILFLASGIVMLWSVNWFFISQPWFIVKFVLFVTLPIRGAVIGKRIMMQVGKQVEGDHYDVPALMKLRARMKRFHFTQYSIVAVILFLVLFKP
jgi:hypothetical protein